MVKKRKIFKVGKSDLDFHLSLKLHSFIKNCGFKKKNFNDDVIKHLDLIITRPKFDVCTLSSFEGIKAHVSKYIRTFTSLPFT